MNKAIILNIEMTYGTIQDAIHPVILVDEHHCVLVDCGYVGALPKIEAALEMNGLAPQAVSHIILTHQDHDHIGAAAAYKKKYPAVSVLASVIEEPYISGKRKSHRLEQAERLQCTLPPEQQAFGEEFCSLLRRVEPVHIDRLLDDGDQLPFCGGCEVVATPGHTPGHISLYLPMLDVVICGDAMALDGGKPVIANPQFALNIAEAAMSLQRLLAYGSKRVICYHGGEFNANTLKSAPDAARD